jgi:hypothetical protein
VLYLQVSFLLQNVLKIGHVSLTGAVPQCKCVPKKMSLLMEVETVNSLPRKNQTLSVYDSVFVSAG